MPIMFLALGLTLGMTMADAMAALVKVEPSACRWLAAYQGDDAAYEPGVDVEGRPVAPADVDSAGIELPEVITVDITVDLQDRFGIPSDSRLLDPDARIGVVEVRGNRLFFNGQPMSDPERQAVSAACRQRSSED